MVEKINNNGFDFVDLGLPSGTLWSTMNVGADKPTDFGLYFQWGDTSGYTANQVGMGEGQKKFASDFSDYKWHLSGDDFDNDNFTKYKTEGDVLELDDDAAHFHMGGSWHMPSSEQIQELINETTSNWIKLDGVNGKLFTSDNGKSIFIPAAGSAWDNSVHDRGSFGGVWSSVLDTYYVDNGQSLNFNSGNAYLGGSNRYYGFSVRGVIG
jgi:hypothetical protein